MTESKPLQDWQAQLVMAPEDGIVMSDYKPYKDNSWIHLLYIGLGQQAFYQMHNAW